MKKTVGLVAKLAFAVAVVYGCVDIIYVIENWLGICNIYTKWMEVIEVTGVVCVTYGATILYTKALNKAISLIENRKNRKNRINLIIYKKEWL